MAFSQHSLDKLSTCDRRLQDVFRAVCNEWSCTIVCGFRGQAEQDKAYADGKSKLQWPHGAHNSIPSKAVDVIPDPTGYAFAGMNYMFAGMVLEIAAGLGVKLRWGGDWSGNRVGNKRGELNDLVHFELIEDGDGGLT